MKRNEPAKASTNNAEMNCNEPLLANDNPHCIVYIDLLNKDLCRIDSESESKNKKYRNKFRILI